MRAEECKVVGLLMTSLLLIVPPALCNVDPKIAKKQIGAITDLKAKKYWTWKMLVQRVVGEGEGPYLGVRNTQEGNLEQEVD